MASLRLESMLRLYQFIDAEAKEAKAGPHRPGSDGQPGSQERVLGASRSENRRRYVSSHLDLLTPNNGPDAQTL